MKVKYEGRSTGGRWIPAPGGEIFVGHGETVEVPEDIARGLLEQSGYTAAKAAKAVKAEEAN